MFNLLKNLFRGSKSINYPTGAVRNSPDSRDIHIAAIQAPVPFPLVYKTDLSMFVTLNQLLLGTCILQSRRMMRQYMLYKKTGKVVKLSARSGYIPSKKIDGLVAGIQGTTARAGDSVLFNFGIAEDAVVPDNNSLSYNDYMNTDVTVSTVALNMAQYKIGGYASVPADFTAIKQAIYQNGVITFTLGIDSNWFTGLIMKVLNILGYHSLLGYGYDATGIFGKNSWGTSWIAQLAQIMGFPAGDFYIKWSDYQNDIYDIVAYVDIPEPILNNAKTLKYYFQNAMQYGQSSPEILQLQNRLDKEGLWPVGIAKTGHYGVTTASCVLSYQTLHKVADIGELLQLQGDYVGPATLRALNGATKLSLEDALIHQESRGNDYAVGDKGHAFGPLQIWQSYIDDALPGHKAEECLGNRPLSLQVFYAYMARYATPECIGRPVTDQDRARIHNGGPDGWKNESTLKYWSEVEPMLIN